MSNATRCRQRAAGYARRAEKAAHPQTRSALRELERLWLEIAASAERFDTKGEAGARERIYSLIDAVGRYRLEAA
jgi:hypothetical protein